LDAVLQAEGFATPTYKARQRLRVVEVCNEVEGVTDWAFDERDEVISHDGLLEIIDWTRKETPQETRPCGVGEKSP
jgi:hypothetical protein